jgi:alcohol dehydrogenase class IV
LLGGSGDGPDLLPTVLRRIMDDVGIPAGLHEVGYTEADIPNLVEGSMAQQRLLALAPVEVDTDDLARVFQESL